MKLSQSWTSKLKQIDKLHIEIRISLVTVFKLSIDKSNNYYELTIANFTIKSGDSADEK